MDKSYEGLVHEFAANEDELIEVINKLSKAITDCKKKMLSFASRQGLLLKEAKQTLEPHNEKNRKSIILPFTGIWSQTRMQAKLTNNRSASKVQQGQNN